MCDVKNGVNIVGGWVGGVCSGASHGGGFFFVSPVIESQENAARHLLRSLKPWPRGRFRTPWLDYWGMLTLSTQLFSFINVNEETDITSLYIRLQHQVPVCTLWSLYIYYIDCIIKWTLLYTKNNSLMLVRYCCSISCIQNATKINSCCTSMYIIAL